MAFRTNAAPYQRAKNSTLKIMLILLAALLVVWVFGIVYSFQLQNAVNDFIGLYNPAADAFNQANADAITAETIEALKTFDTVNYGLKSILMVVVAVAVTAACDVITTILRHKKDSKESLGKEIVYDLVHNYSWISAVIFALCLPVYTPYYVIIIGSIFATVVVKNFFGGFGKNIFNPAIMARIFVGLCFGSLLAVPEVLTLAASGVEALPDVLGIGAGAGVDVATGATLTTAYNNTTGWLDTTMNGKFDVIYGSIFANYGIKELLFGQYVGALGETFTVVIFALGIILSVLKVINWRTPVFYLGTVALTSLVIALVLGLDSPFSYVLYHLSLGGVMFGAVFMLTDPVTGPTSPFGKSLTGVIAGLLTVVIRVKGGYPEGVMFSIAICNLISPAIDYFTVGKSSSHLVRKCCVVFGTLLVSIGLCTGLSWKLNGGQEVYAINGINAVKYSYLEEALQLEEGHYYAPATDYEVQTPKKVMPFELAVDENGEVIEQLDAVYYVVDKNGTKVGVAYLVNTKSKLGYGQYSSHGIVVINNDGTLHGVGFFEPIWTTGANDFSSFAPKLKDKGQNDFKGKTKDDYKKVEKITGATNSTSFLKKFVEEAYKEFEAAYGGDE